MPDSPLPRRSLLAVAVGAVRVLGIVALLVLATPVLLLSILAPRRADGTRGVHVAGQAVCRAFLAICGVRWTADDAEALAAHRGLVFFNHPSFIDPLVMMSARPVRFLGAAGVQRIPFVGAMARAAGTLFVDRGDAASRSVARGQVRDALDDPTPVALAPEGGIWKGEGVGPLRHGAFEVAADAGAPILLVGIRYSDRRRLAWHDGEWLLAPLWRLCARTGPFEARLTVGDTLVPDAASPDVLATRAQMVLSGLVDAAQWVTDGVPTGVRRLATPPRRAR